MKRYISILIIFACCLLSAQAQGTKAEAKKLFANGEYEAAKPIFERLLKGSPKSGEYNYWYAVCCMETGDTVADVKSMLELAITRNVKNAYFYLGEYHKRADEYDEAVVNYDKYAVVGSDEELLLAAAERSALTRKISRMVKNTEKVCVIDSFVVDKNELLSAYNVGRDAGILKPVSEFFNNKDMDGVLYETERLTDIYYPKALPVTDSLSVYKLFHSARNGDKWSEARQLKGIETGGNDCYPFMCSDGTTFYFSSDGEGSIGGLDIFMSRYDSEDGSFLLPVNVGMPFNSEANDYMMAVNDIANLGWFATDRRMPEGKVCVYVFIPNSSKISYNYEALGHEKMVLLAGLHSIADTQSDETAMRNARRQFLMLLYEDDAADDDGDFEFVVDDMTIYKALEDFKSEEARKLYATWQERSEKLRVDSAHLDTLRDKYAASDKQQKQAMARQILALERAVEEEEVAVKNLLKRVRETEIKKIRK